MKLISNLHWIIREQPTSRYQDRLLSEKAMGETRPDSEMTPDEYSGLMWLHGRILDDTVKAVN